MNTTETILEYRKKLNSINNSLIAYADWIKNLDINEVNNIIQELDSKLDLILLQTKLSNSLNFLKELKQRTNNIFIQFSSDINNLFSTFKITEYNKFTKDILQEVESIKLYNQTEYNSIKNEMETLTRELNSKINAENLVKEFKEKTNNLEQEINKKIDTVFETQSTNQLNKLQNDSASLVLKITNFNTMLENFNNDILSQVSENKKLASLISKAEMYVVKHNLKSNLNALEYNEYLEIKEEFYLTLKKYSNFINMQAINLANEISNFFSVDSVNFNDTWAFVTTKKDIDTISESDLKQMQKIIKDTNNLIDNLSKNYGKFIDNVYEDYAKHLTNIKFDLKNSKSKID